MSSRRASTCFCFSLCGAGMYSSLETIWVGIGVVCGSISAGIKASSSSLVRKLIVASLLKIRLALKICFQHRGKD